MVLEYVVSHALVNISCPYTLLILSCIYNTHYITLCFFFGRGKYIKNNRLFIRLNMTEKYSFIII